MTTIILGNANNLSVADDSSNGDTIIVGNGIDDAETFRSPRLLAGFSRSRTTFAASRASTR
jgi:hypothetical protein